MQHFVSGMFQPSPYKHCLMASARARNLAKECQISRRFNEENHCDLFVEIHRDGILSDFREISNLKESSMSVWNSEKNECSVRKSDIHQKSRLEIRVCFLRKKAVVLPTPAEPGEGGLRLEPVAPGGGGRPVER